MEDCIFCKIANKEIVTNFLYEDDEVVAFPDASPQAPLHLLIIPKAHIGSAAELTQGDGAMLGKVFQLAAQLVQQQGYTEGYRVVTNVGAQGGQSVPHLHFHVLAGRQMGWPPG